MVMKIANCFEVISYHTCGHLNLLRDPLFIDGVLHQNPARIQWVTGKNIYGLLSELAGELREWHRYINDRAFRLKG